MIAACMLECFHSKKDTQQIKKECETKKKCNHHHQHTRTENLKTS
jgi:hypothetical protein